MRSKSLFSLRSTVVSLALLSFVACGGGGGGGGSTGGGGGGGGGGSAGHKGKPVAGLALLEARKLHLPADDPPAFAVVSADVDGDGDQDLVVGTRKSAPDLQRNRLYVGDGTGVFADASGQLPNVPVADGDVTMAIVAGDIDGDGDVDLITGNSDERAAGSGVQNRVLVNDGKGTFADETAARLPAALDRTSALALGDVDGDNDLDLIVGNQTAAAPTVAATARNRLYLNDGNGKFTDATASLPATNDETGALVLGDVDGDGDLDVVVGNRKTSTTTPSEQNRLLLNDGKGKFTDATSQLPVDVGATFALALGDVDGDQDLDLVCGNQVRMATDFDGARNCLYLNDGKGNFTDASANLPADESATFAVGLADLDGDTDLDLFVANAPDFRVALQARVGGANQILLNDGKGKFAAPAGGPGSLEPTTSCAFADVDGDKDLDVLCGNANGSTRLYFNDGKAVLVDGVGSGLPAGAADGHVALGDVDDDGDLDLFVARRDDVPNQLWLNDGYGGFTDASDQLPAVHARSLAAAFADVDGDGDLDIAVANSDDTLGGSRNWLFENDGKGSFKDVTVQQMPSDGDRSTGLLFVDVDGDKDLDLVVANGEDALQQNRLYLNDGKGSFAAGTLPAIKDASSSVAAGDVDGDGDVDLAFGNVAFWNGQLSGGRSRIYLNDGKGVFSDGSVGLPSFQDGTRAVALADVDDDGDLDLVCGNAPVATGGTSYTGGQNRIYVNDGKGVFKDLTINLPDAKNATFAIAVADIDGDGDLDLACANSRVKDGDVTRNVLYANDGTGKFFLAEPGGLGVDVDRTLGIALGDVDFDGDVDIIAGRLYRNTYRHVTTPFVVRLGKPYLVELYAQAGMAPPNQFAMPWLSFSRVDPPLPWPPFGKWGLNVFGLVSGSPVVIPSPDGKATFQFVVPNEKILAGQSIYTQLLVLHTTDFQTWRLSNRVGDRVLP